MNGKPSDVGRAIADELAACGVRLVASLSRVAAHQACPELPAEVTTISSVRWRASARKQST